MTRFPSPFWLALILCLMNVAKPLTIDDSAYHLFARQVAQSPLDPYGFTICWYQWPHPAMEVLAPPMFPTYLGLGMRLLGDHPILWKLWLFPICWLLTASLHALFRRFCRGLERSLTAMTALSPMILPSVNLMLDVPTLALMLAGLVLFFKACDDNKISLAILSGLILGIAMETKYTAFVGPCVVVLYGMLHRRWWLTLIPPIVAASVFIGIEALIAAKYGESHFLYHVESNHSDTPFDDKLKLVLPLFGYIGGLGLPIALLGFAVIGAPRKVLVTIGGGFIVGLLLIGALPNAWQQWFNGQESGIRISLNSTLMIISWALVFSSLLLCTLMLVVRSNGTFRQRADVWFLIGWFWMELGASFVLTPFPAARRVMALLVVSTFVVGRLASRRPQFRPLIHGVAWFGIGLGCFYAMIDFVDAFAEKRAAQIATERIEGEGERWYVGHWGFQFYADRYGMRQIFPDESVLEPGDWLILPDSGLRPVAQSIRLDESKVELRSQFELSLPMPYRTLPDMYGGRSPIAKHEGPRIRISIYRVLDRWKPESFFP